MGAERTSMVRIEASRLRRYCAAILEGLQWFGGHKGFGIAFLVEILAGVLTNSSHGRTERSTSSFGGKARVAKGYLFLTLDVGRFPSFANGWMN
jgi:LDH2 family malate/lactate/ureidoglycolate dehydrogenase